MFLSCFSAHLESLEVSWKQIGVRDEVIGLRMRSSLLVKVFPHIILSSEIPAAWKMVDFLKFIHIF